MHDGGKVEYIGLEQDGLRFGERGHVLSCTAAYAHVQWLEGVRKGEVGLHSTDDLQVVTASVNHIEASLDDSLEVGSLTTLASAQEAYEEAGGDGLVSHLASAGYLSAHASAAEEALQLITASLQLDPMLRQLTSTMDTDEAEAVYRLAARNLLIDSGDFS